MVPASTRRLPSTPIAAAVCAKATPVGAMTGTRPNKLLPKTKPAVLSPWISRIPTFIPTRPFPHRPCKDFFILTRPPASTAFSLQRNPRPPLLFPLVPSSCRIITSRCGPLRRNVHNVIEGREDHQHYDNREPNP